jgi:hypothetical protein
MSEKNDEIADLRAEVAYWKGYAETRVELARRTNEHAVKVQAENERLKAALNITTEGLEWCVIRAEAMPTPDVGAGSFARICLDKARAALKEDRT